MAFVNRSNRGLTDRPPKEDKVGPGAYIGHSDFKIRNS
jgi:hypothetical protein